MLSIISSSVLSEGLCNIDDLNCDGYIDHVTTTNNTVVIADGATGRRYSGKFDLEGGSVSKGFFPKTIIIDTNFESPSNPYINQYTFRWNDEKKDWFLEKSSYWIDESKEDNKSYPKKFEVKRYSCCISLDKLDEARSKQLNQSDYEDDIQKDLDYIDTKIKENKFNDLFSLDYKNPKIFPVDFSYELSLILSQKNVERINNIAFFSVKYRQPIPAIIILRDIVNKFPDRVVAYLNLADAYYAVGDNVNAKKSYVKYASMMRDIGKENRIPKRVIAYIK